MLRSILAGSVLLAADVSPRAVAAQAAQRSPADTNQEADRRHNAHVTLRPAGVARGRLSFRAEVVDYNGNGLTLKMESGQLKRYRPDEVISVTPDLSASHQQADRLFHRRQWREAALGYRAALGEERDPQRAWVRRQILAQMVRAFRAAGDLVTAGETFLRLYRSDPDTVHFSVIPLEWIGRVTTEPVYSRAEHWMNESTEPVARLLGASHLLTSSQRSDALIVLEQELTRDLDRRVRELALAQVWRTKVVTADLHAVESWQRQIESMPEALRGGPYYVLGQAYAQLGDPQAAALAYLWVPLVYDHDRELAGRSLLGAARALEKLGQHSEAVTLIEEVRDRFGETEAARASTSVLRNIAGEVEPNR